MQKSRVKIIEILWDLKMQNKSKHPNMKKKDFCRTNQSNR